MRSSFLIHNVRRMMQMAFVIALLAVLVIVVPASAVASKCQTSTTVTSSPNPSTVGQAVTLTANVSPLCNGTGGLRNSVPNPTGTVTFKDSGAVIGSGTLSSPATFTTSSLAKGSHNITAEYGGDSNYSGSVSAIWVHQVKDPPEVPEADTLLLFGGALGGLATWARWQWARRVRRK